MRTSSTILGAVLLGLFSMAVSAQSLTCNADRNESQAFQTAPEGAKRLLGDHVLAVNYKSGTRQFIDKPPYDEQLSGLHWRYCGYIPSISAHLVGVSKGGLFSGKLLVDDNGLLLDAGHTVYPSPNGKLFLAIKQEDGMDGELWLVSDLSGKRVWAGYAGTTKMVTPVGKGAKPYEAVESTVEDPQWTAHGVLHARVVCSDSSGTKGTATLKLIANVWHWKSDVACKN